jgi:hypothetical protein
LDANDKFEVNMAIFPNMILLKHKLLYINKYYLYLEVNDMSEKAINKIEQEIEDLVLEEKLILLERIIHRLKEDATKRKRKDFSIYRGIYKNLNIDVEKSIDEMRQEWERNIL